MFILIHLWRFRFIQIILIPFFLMLQLITLTNANAFELKMLNEVYNQDNVLVNFNKVTGFVCNGLREVSNITCGEYESDIECRQRKQLLAKFSWKYTQKWYIAKHKLSLKYHKDANAFESYSLDLGGYSRRSFEKK